MSLINDALKRAHEAQKRQAPTGPLGAPLQPAEPPRRPGGAGAGSFLVPVILILLLGLSFWLIRGWWISRRPAGAPAVAAAPQILPEPPRPTAAVPVIPLPSRPEPPVAPVPSPAPAPVKPKEVAKAPTPPRSGIVVNTNVVVRELPVAVVPANPARPSPAPAVEPAPAAASVAVAGIATDPPVPVTLPAAPSGEPVSGGVPPLPAAPAFPELKLQGIFYRKDAPEALISGKSVRVGGKVKEARVTAIERTSVTLEFGGQRRTLSLE